jgi:hypothetical protein
MKRLFLSLMFSTLCLLLLGITAFHVAPDSFVPGSDTDLLIEVADGQETLSGIDLLYRGVGSEQWLSEPMRQDDPNSPYWRGSIPGIAISTNDVEYRFEYKLKDGSTDYLPQDDGFSPFNSLTLSAPKVAAAGESSKGFVLISDESSVSADDGYILAVSYLTLAESIDPKSIKVFVGDKDVTNQTEISGSVLLYREENPQDGIKKAMVTAKVKGKDVVSDTWITQILPGTVKRALPFTYRGSVNFASNIYDQSDKNLSMGDPENDFRAWADLYGNYGNLDMQTNILVSSLEDSNKQPVNRYTFGIQLPALDVFLGDYSPALSQYTLYGKNIRGLYGKLKTRFLELSVAHGEALRKTTTAADTLLNTRAIGTFKQEAVGARVQFGSESSFRLGISGSRHRDIISSLDEEYYRYTNAENDTIYTAMAQDNAVLSIDAQINVPDQNFVLGFEGAASMLNKNTIPGPLSTEDLEEYDLDLELAGTEINPADFEDIFVINKNMEPLMPGRANIAWNAYLRMYFWNNLLNLQYSETGSAFNTLGSQSRMNDTREISVTDQINFGRALFLSGGFTLTQDNLMEHNSETNIYQSIFAQAIVRYPNLPYLKAGFNLNTGENESNNDIIDDNFEPFERNSQNMNFGIGYNIVQIPYVPTQLDISYRFGFDESERETQAGALQKITDNNNQGMAFTMNNRFSMIPLRTQISYATSTNNNDILDKEYQNNSLFLKADYQIWENRIKPYISYRNTNLSKDNTPQKYNYFNLGLESYPIRNMTVTADMGLMNYKNDDDSSRDYDTTTFRLCLTQRF